MHFEFNPNQKSVNTSYHSSGVKVFDINEFLYLNMKCSKLTTFSVAAASDTYASGTYVYNLKHTEDPNAPVLKYWLNNWGTGRVSSNIKKVTSDSIQTRLAVTKPIQYQMLNGEEGYIRFAGQIEGSNIMSYIAGNYSDTLNIALSY